VKARSTGPDGATNEDTTDARGRFRLTEVPPGTEYRIWATPHGAPETEEPVRAQAARAGDSDVVIAIDAGSPLVVRIDGWPESAIGTALVSHDGDAAVGRSWSARIQSDGSFRVDGLERGTYTLWVASPAYSGVCVFETGLRPGGAEVRVRTRKTRDLTFREESADPVFVRSAQASVAGVPIMQIEPYADVRRPRVFRDVPDDLTVRVELVADFVEDAKREERIVRGEADAPPGATTVIVPVADVAKKR
jgi:hypothetical protein